MEYLAHVLDIDESRGFMKVDIDKKDDRILGRAVLGVDGSEVMSVTQIAVMGGLTVPQLRDAMFAHPTLVESLNNRFA